MVNINLLPAEIVAARKRRVVRDRIISLICLLAFILLISFSALFVLTQYLQSQVSATRQARVSTEAAIASYRPAELLREQVNARESLLTAAMGAQLDWRDTLSAVGANIPDNVWLTNMSLTSDDEAGLLIMRGGTYNHPGTAGWVRSLAAIEGIGDVRVSFSAVEEGDDTTWVRFEMQAVLVAGELYQPLRRGE